MSGFNNGTKSQHSGETEHLAQRGQEQEPRGSREPREPREQSEPDGIIEAFYSILGEFFTAVNYVPDTEGTPVPENINVATSLLSIAQSLHQQNQIQLEILQHLRDSAPATDVSGTKEEEVANGATAYRKSCNQASS